MDIAAVGKTERKTLQRRDNVEQKPTNCHQRLRCDGLATIVPSKRRDKARSGGFGSDSRFQLLCHAHRVLPQPDTVEAPRTFEIFDIFVDTNRFVMQTGRA